MLAAESLSTTARRAFSWSERTRSVDARTDCEDLGVSAWEGSVRGGAGLVGAVAGGAQKPRHGPELGRLSPP